MDFTGITINGRYELIKKLTDGRSSYLYLANSIGSKTNPVAIKIFKDNVTSKKTEDLIRFKHDINVLLKIRHPNIISIYDVGEIYKLQFVVMEYAEGEALHEVLKNAIPPLDLVIDITLQVLKALDCLHRNGIVHRDLKPGHLIMHKSGESPGMSIKLIDSGFICIKDFNELMKSEEISDLIGYTSPEQSGLIKRQVDGRSDLYSLGIIFYQMLTGKQPFADDDSFLFLHGHKSKVPILPSRLNPRAHSILDRIVLKLIENEPEKRYQSAGGLLFDLERYKSGETEFIAGLNDASIRLTYRTTLVGRDKEVERLRRLFDSAIEDCGGGCLIAGEPGIGKTRLVEELGEYIQSKGAAFIYAKCFPGENKEPFRLLKDALNGYLKIFGTYTDKKKREIRNKIKASVGALGEIILKLNPGMIEILGTCPFMAVLEPVRENIRFLTVASRFFLNLSGIEHGLVLSIDDLQWCDEGSLELIRLVIEGALKSPLLIIGVYRSGETAEGRILTEYINAMKGKGNPLTEIALDSLSSPLMNKFISGLLYEDETSAKEISDFVYKKSKGNPFFAIEILKQLVDERAIFYKNKKWEIDHALLSRSVIPVTVIDTLIKRISLLQQKEAVILSYAAIIGRSFNIDLLFRLRGECNKNELVGIIDKCVRLQLIEQEVKENGRLSFMHDRIREAFYGSIDPKTRKCMHAQIADALEEIHKNNKNEVLFDLTHHYLESGNRDKSLEYAYPASFKAVEAFANEDALRYFGIAVELLDEKISSGEIAARPLWMKSKEGMARVYLRIGRYDEAINIFNELLPYTDNDISRAFVLRSISSAYNKKGDWGSCEKYAKIGIELLGGKLPVKRGPVVLSLIKEILIHCLHVLFPGWFVIKHQNPKARKKIIQGIFYESLIYTYILSERLKYVRAVLKILNQVERYSAGGQALAKVLCGYGTLLMSFTRFGAALKYLYKSLAISKEINDQFNIGRTFQLVGYCYEWQGEFEKAIVNYNKAIDVFNRIGDSNGIGITLNGLSNSYFLIADFNNLRTTNDKFFEISHKSKDNYQICNALISKTLYYLGTGKLNEAETHALAVYDLSCKNKIWMPYCIINILLGIIYYSTRNIIKSIEHLQRAKELYEKHGFLKHYTIYLYPYIADAYIAEFIVKKEITEKQIEFYLKRIKKSCKLALRKTKRMIPHHAHSLIVNAKYYALIKKNKKAKNFFLQGVELSSKLGMKLESVKNLYEYGRFLSKTGDNDSSRKTFESSYQISEEIGSSIYSERLRGILGIEEITGDSTSIQKFVHSKRLLLIDRLSSEINRITDLDELFNAVISNAVEITCAQKGCLFVANDNNELELKVYKNILECEEFLYSQEIIENVFKNGEKINTIFPVVDDEKINDRSVKYSDIRSILSIPIKMNDRVIGVCYLENYLSNGQFTEEDVNLLAAYIAKVSASIQYACLYCFSKINKNDEQWIITPSIEKKMNTAISYLKENYRFNIAREGLANMLNINSDNLGRYFRMYTGEKIGDYINRLRVEEAAKKLRETDVNVIHIAFSAGFENISTFNKAFVKFMKTTPTHYRKSALGNI